MITIVCLGDSITAGYPYSKNESWVALCQQQLNFNLINAGVSSETTADLLRRFDRHVQPHHPQIVIILAGTNDVWYEVMLKETAANFKQLVSKVQDIGAQPILGLPTPIINERVVKFYNQSNIMEFNKHLNDIRNWVANFAKKNSIPVLDFYNPVRLADTDQGDPQFFCSDGEHPSIAGYKKLADSITSQLNLIINKL